MGTAISDVVVKGPVERENPKRISAHEDLLFNDRPVVASAPPPEFAGGRREE
jgi:hypothetical protein